MALTLEATCLNLCSQLRQLRDALAEVYVGVVEDRPQPGDAVLVDVFGNTAEDLIGWLDEALAAAAAAREAVAPPVRLDDAHRALGACHERFHEVAHRYGAELVSFRRISDLRRLGRNRRGEWLVWTGSIQESLERCRAPLHDASLALVRCWQEFAEHAGSAAHAGPVRHRVIPAATERTGRSVN
jgi:hypothetical protein